MLSAEFVQAISDIGEQDWEALRSHDYPFTRYAYLHTLEATGCVGGNSGWQPKHLILKDGTGVKALLPLYRKDHSYGEYVFDWSWAQAWAQAGLNYYPKLVCAIPFTPVPGPRLLTDSSIPNGQLCQIASSAIQKRCEEAGYSGWHLLFPEPEQREAFKPGMLERNDVQFHWHNQDYVNFDDFLSGLRSNKRKQIRRERRRVAEQGVTLKRLSGEQLDSESIDAFYDCYCETYLRRSGHTGYLNREFFEQISNQMAEQMMLVLAYREELTIAASLFFFDSEALYGRYWGALDDVDCLHFEACYYQGIEFAIERGLHTFNPGTQGEHKLVRGFEPVSTSSLHWVADARFRPALQDFLKRERDYKTQYSKAAENCLPFHKNH